MNLHTCFLTNNNCYKTNRKHTVKGIMVHSTGVDNPNLKRYVQPDDGLLGENTNGNHWNTATPSGRSVCVHAFIGKLKDGTIATYQTLPWDICGWHSGQGSKGNANFLGYIGFEICEDNWESPEYFNAAYKEAVELCTYLCKQFNLTEKDIICHSEGNTLGIASKHADVMHWFPRFGKSMDTLRSEVKMALEKDNGSEWSKEYREWAIKNGIITGDENGNCHWTDNVTREELATILKRFNDLLCK